MENLPKPCRFKPPPNPTYCKEIPRYFEKNYSITKNLICKQPIFLITEISIKKIFASPFSMP